MTCFATSYRLNLNLSYRPQGKLTGYPEVVGLHPTLVDCYKLNHTSTTTLVHFSLLTVEILIHNLLMFRSLLQMPGRYLHKKYNSSATTEKASD